MSHSLLVHAAERTDSIQSDPTVQKLRVPSTQSKQPGFDLGERPFFQPTDEKFDAEALRDWKAKAALPSYQPFL
jgi:hypothetical protein